MAILQTSRYFTHWNYFLALEKDLENLSRFIEFSEDNWTSYSLEMARIILAAAADVDVLLKSLCKRESPSVSAESINSYMNVINDKLPNIPAFEARLPRWGLNLIPWENWSRNAVPDWWTAYNKVKHHRGEHYPKANLHNTINAVAALYIINLYFYKEQAENGELLPSCVLFRPSDEHCRGTSLINFELGIDYEL